MQIGSTTSDLVLHLDNITVTSVNVVKNLGVFVDSRLKFECHINKIVARAFPRGNLIHKCFFPKTLLRWLEHSQCM